MTVLGADDLNTDPFLLFNQWFAEAQQSEINDPDAIALASVDEWFCSKKSYQRVLCFIPITLAANLEN